MADQAAATVNASQCPDLRVDNAVNDISPVDDLVPLYSF